MIEMDIARSITTAVKTGKVLFGAENAIKSAKIGRARLIIISSNCPQKIGADIQYYCRLSKIPVIVYDKTSADLGTVCGKPFIVSALTIREPGDSEILKMAKPMKSTGEM